MTRFAEGNWHSRYNVAPSQTVETIISVNGEKRLGPMRWGFVSPTAKELAPINARVETLATLPMSRDAFRRHRCLVVADGFYEWGKNEGHRRTSLFIRLRSGRPFGFVSIWSTKKGTRLATRALATCPPSELMAKIHHRMPAILSERQAAAWLADSPRPSNRTAEPRSAGVRYRGSVNSAAYPGYPHASSPVLPVQQR